MTPSRGAEEDLCTQAPSPSGTDATSWGLPRPQLIAKAKEQRRVVLTGRRVMSRWF